ncbi:MAG: ribosome maturation factor RimP [bacterium]|nr:ribosome maturation factor RimP [bacterium]
MDRYELAGRAVDLLAAPLAAQGFDLLDVRVFRGGGRLTLRVYLDREGGIGVDDCAEASRTAGMLVEEAGIVADAYVIEVSSPGVRRPLRTTAHFGAAVGQDVILKVAADGPPRTVKGRLEAADESRLQVRTAPDQEPLEIPRGRVREASLDPEFDAQALIQADRRRRKDEKQQARQARRQTRER